MAYLHKIKAWLYDNPLTPDPNDFVARVISEKSLSLEDICESAVKRGGADMNADTMARAARYVFKEMTYRLCDGFSVNLGWIYLQAAIKGIFNSPRETFDPKKHRLTVDVAIGSEIRKELKSIEVEMQGVADVSLYIAEVQDIKSKTVNDMLTPGKTIKIFGEKLKIAGENDANSVYFINKATQERTKVPLDEIAFNEPKMLSLNVPDLPAGEYKIEVTTQFGAHSATLLKEPRTAIFERILTVL
ncbi:MAG: DUF4469 domain-containing protein [Fibromonadaceae bacterium]|jgi:hypothetical protein|nr:DUF4469 domain-containing protein [Fibromonadaceae bacterium]